MDERLFRDRFVRAIGMPSYRKPFYMLRHTYVTALMVDPRFGETEVSKLVGHASSRITQDTYGHLLPSEVDRVGLAQLETWHQGKALASNEG